MIVGFAAETNPDLDAARAKLARKGSDLLVMNQVGNGQGFGAGDNEWIVLDNGRHRNGHYPPVQGRPGRRGTGPGQRSSYADRPSLTKIYVS